MSVRAPKYPNRLREAIKHQGFTVKEVAEETAIPVRTLFDYCAGRMPIPRKRLELLAHTIGCPIGALVSSYADANSASLVQSEEESLGVLDVTRAVEKPVFSTAPLQSGEDQNECNTSYFPQETGTVQVAEGIEGVNRREANKKITDLAGGLLIVSSKNMLYPPLWERLARTLTKSFNVDEVTLQGLEQITRSYWQLRASVGYRNLIGGFQGHLETVVQLLRCPQSTVSHKRLCAVSSEIAQRIGAINFDINDYSTARAYYKVSIEAAKESENYTLWAAGLGRMSFLPTSGPCSSR